MKLAVGWQTVLSVAIVHGITDGKGFLLHLKSWLSKCLSDWEEGEQWAHNISIMWVTYITAQYNECLSSFVTGRSREKQQSSWISLKLKKNYLLDTRARWKVLGLASVKLGTSDRWVGTRCLRHTTNEIKLFGRNLWLHAHRFQYKGKEKSFPPSQ